MKAPGPSARMSQFLGDESLVWVEQHHRTTAASASAANSKTSFNYSNSGLSSSGLDYPHSGDENESDTADRHRSQFYVADPLKRTKEYHLDQAVQAIQLLKAAAKPDGWKKVIKHKSGCLVYQATGGGDKHPAFKGEHVIRGYRAQDVFSVVGVRKLWDDWYDELSCVESYDESTNLMYMVMKSTLSSKTRDISMVERIEVERDGTIYFASCSVESNKIPRISGKVRADIFVAGWIIQPLPSNPPITKITYVIQTDLLSRLPKFIARRSLAKRPLVITTIETHLKKNGAPMVMSNLVSQTANRHRSLSEPLKPEKFMFSEESSENVQSGSAFLNPIGPLKNSGEELEQLDDRDETVEYEIQQTIAAINDRSASRNSCNSLAPSLMSTRSIAPSIFSQEFIENNAVLGDTALFGDSALFGKGGIFESTIRSDGTQARPQDQKQTHLDGHQDRSNRPPTSAVRPLSPESEPPSRHSSVGLDHRTSNHLTTPKSGHRSRTSRHRDPSTPEPLRSVVTPATPPLTPTTSTDGKDAASDSDASMTARVKVVPRIPKTPSAIDPSLPPRPSSMAFAAHGMGVRSPSSIMEARRHSTLIGRSSSFAPRHSTIIPMRSNPNLSLANLNRASALGFGGYGGSNTMKRQSTVPSLNSDRSSSNGGGYTSVVMVPHRHSETARKALAMFKVLASSPEDRWRAVSNDDGFKSYSRVISGAGLPMLRGEGVITGGWTVEQINAVIESAGCRNIWDERFENLSVAETFNQNEYLFHVTLRGVSSLTGRDLAGVTIVDRDVQTSALYNVSTSVLDPTIPEDPGRIRALLELSGWSLRPTFDGQGNTVAVNVTFVIQIDIRGTLPNSVVKSMTASMTTAVSRLNQFLNKTGYPPYASHISGTRLLDTFDPTTGFYELCYKAAPGWTEIRVGRKVYKDGYDFFIKPDDPTVRVELAPDFGGVRVWTTLDHEGQSIVAQVTRKGQNPALSISKESNEDESGSEDYNRHDSSQPPRERSRDSHVPSSSPSYSSSSSLSFGPGPHRKRSSTHYQTQSNDETDVYDIGSGSIRSMGGAGTLSSMPLSSPSSIGRKRRSAERLPTFLSAFDANTDDDVVASEPPQTSTLESTILAAASPSCERKGRSRTRAPRSLITIPAGAPSPPLPRRSSSLSRYSIPLSAYLAQEDAPPVPINSATTVSISSPIILPSQSLAPLDTSSPSTIKTYSPSVSGPEPAVASQPGSPTLGPFHIPHFADIVRGTKESLTKDAVEEEAVSLVEDSLEAFVSSREESSKVVNSSTEDPAKVVATLSDPPTTTIPPFQSMISTSAAASSAVVTAVSLTGLDDAPSSSIPPPPPTPPKRTASLIQKEQIQTPAEEEAISVATVDVSETETPTLEELAVPSGETPPSDDNAKTTLAPPPRASSLKHSSSSSSTARRVTFSPDVRDICAEDKPSRIKPRARRSKKGKKVSAVSPLDSLANKEEVQDGAVIVSTVGALAKKGVRAVVVVEKEYESDEAEFVEAQEELFVDQENEEKVVKISTMELEHDMEDYARVWEQAPVGLARELRQMQVRIVVLSVVLWVYANYGPAAFSV
ncbi:hypothetical protein BG006_005251 [Podila minutissima]|uniref:START domain-containing protein n=1 Tax=Podila minutissima TaxID=64525 RepID=A0A9P5VM64_9FUNG|nr:hypothetical protein BG006_005251 [Podila minutissima]